MALDFERVVFGVFLAALLPRTSSSLHPVWRAVIGVAIVLYAAIPVATWPVVLALALGAATVASIPRRRADWRWPVAADLTAVLAELHAAWISLRSKWYALAIGLLVVFLCLIAAAGSAEPDYGIKLLTAAVTNNLVAIVLFGGLGAVFLANPIVRIMVKGPLRDLGAGGAQMLPSGRAIGHLERFVVFVLIVGGHPEAAAIAVTLKSIIRIPDAQNHRPGFVEYFLVGTLASVGVALTSAIIVRILLGQAPL
jgi:hypothetical protein